VATVPIRAIVSFGAIVPIRGATTRVAQTNNRIFLGRCYDDDVRVIVGHSIFILFF